MSNIIRLEEIPQGPNISGTVQVPLAELDRMRADHARLRKIAEDLQEKQMMVLIQVSKYHSHLETSANGRLYNVDRLHVEKEEYKNLDEVKEQLKKQVADEYLDALEVLKKEHYELKKTNSELKSVFDQTCKELKEVKNKLVKCEEERIEDIQTIENLQNKVSDNEFHIQGIESRLKLALEDLKKEQCKKGFWSFLK